MENLKFGEAIEAVKQGKLVARKGWNGKAMFIFQRPTDTYTSGFIQKIVTIPVSVKKWFENNVDENQAVFFTSYLCMKAADNTIVNGWLASQTDMLAEDWCILD